MTKDSSSIKEYAVIILALSLLVIVFLWRIFFLGEVLLPADLVNAGNAPWALAEQNRTPPGTRIHNRELGDPIIIYYPTKSFVENSLEGGEFPLWNPYAFAGYPFVGRVMTQIINPLDFPYYILPARYAAGYATALRLLLAGIFMYGLARYLRMSPLGSFLAAAIFMFNANTVVWLEFSAHLKGQLYTPLILFFFIRAIDKSDLRSLLLGGIVYGLQSMSGIPQTIQHTAIAIGVFVLVEIIYRLRSQDPWSKTLPLGPSDIWVSSDAGRAPQSRTIAERTLPRKRTAREDSGPPDSTREETPLSKKEAGRLPALWRTFSWRALPVVYGAALALVALLVGMAFILPFYEGLHASIRMEQTRGLAGSNFSFLLTLILPLYRALIGGGGLIRGNFTETVRYVGLLPLFLAALATFQIRRKEVLYAFLLGLVVILVAAGTPLEDALANTIPFFDKGNILRILALLPISLSLLAGFGLSYLESWTGQNRSTNHSLLKPQPKGNPDSSASSPNTAIPDMNRRTSPGMLRLTLTTIFLAALLSGAAAWTFHRVEGLPLSLRHLESWLPLLSDRPLLHFVIFLSASVLVLLAYGLWVRSRQVKQGKSKLKATSLVSLGHRGLRGPVLKWTLLAFFPLLTIADLFAFGIDYNTTSPPDQIYFSTPGLEMVKEDPGIFRVLGIGHALPSNSAWVYSLQDAEGYDPILPQRYADFIAFTQGKGSIAINGKMRIDQLYPRLLQLLNIRFIFSDSYLTSRGYFVDQLEEAQVQADQPEMVKPGNWHFQEHHIPMILTSPNSTISFRTRLPDFPAQLIFYLSTDPATWNEEEGDGVIYRILLQPVEEESPQEEGNPGEGQTDLDQVEKVGKTEIFVQHIDPINNQADRRWYRQMEDLSPWVGQEVILTLVTEAGANDQNDSPGWGNPMIVPPGWIDSLALAYDREIKVYRYLEEQPRAFLVYRSRIIPEDRKILETLFYDPTFQLQQEVILEKGKTLGQGGSLTSSPPMPPEVEIVKYRQNEIILRARPEQESYLVVLDSYHPDWQAFVNGQEEKLLRANYNFRALYLPPGEHLVRIVYRPRDLMIGVTVSALSLGAALALLTYLGWKHKKSAQGETQKG
ncbi:MAG: hypothetical protein DDT18_01670 [Actinobacteria bacterium]|nr:hypothetical protein [Actinomycetota bacterium]